jgi:hypothetical protein
MVYAKVHTFPGRKFINTFYLITPGKERSSEKYLDWVWENKLKK